jgi:UPF0755 protein
MTKPARRRRWPLAFVVLALIVVAVWASWSWVKAGTQPAQPGAKPTYVRFKEAQSLEAVLTKLKSDGLIRNETALRLFATLRRYPSTVQPGTYEVGAGMSGEQILDAIQKPMRQMVRIPETNWSYRTANVLKNAQVVSDPEEYNRLVAHPQEFKSDVSFPLPNDTLEGYLYPDTYDLPPLLGARETILRQLKAFERKVWEGLKHPKNLDRLITVASLVELEVARDEERPVVAGVIENRLKRGMPLQIDAALMYGKRKWKALTRADLTTPGPYNNYLNKGLPPTPICSPTVKSIEAALHPSNHNYLYYVAIDGKSYFASDYTAHLKNVAALRRAEAAERSAQSLQGNKNQ